MFKNNYRTNLFSFLIGFILTFFVYCKEAQANLISLTFDPALIIHILLTFTPTIITVYVCKFEFQQINLTKVTTTKITSTTTTNFKRRVETEQKQIMKISKQKKRKQTTLHEL